MKRYLITVDDGILNLYELADDALVLRPDGLGSMIADPDTVISKEKLREIAWAASLRACCGAYTAWQTWRTWRAVYGKEEEKPMARQTMREDES